MASDKLFYFLFHSNPDLILRWLEDLPADAGGYSLQLMGTIDDVLLPWTVDLVLSKELPSDLLAQLGRVGRCIWRRPRRCRPAEGWSPWPWHQLLQP